MAACRGASPPASPLDAPLTTNQIAERYVGLALALSLHDPQSLEAYTGPASRTFEVARARPPLVAIAADAGRLHRLASEGTDTDATAQARRAYLAAQLRAVAARARQRSGQRLSFRDEAREVFGLAIAEPDLGRAEALRAALARELPGAGPLAARYAAFRARFAVPMHEVAPLFSRALARARADTRARLSLPDAEQARVETTWGRPWPAFTWYEGDMRSLVQLAIDTRFDVAQIVQLACHEGYPGHHVQNVLRDQALVRQHGFVEYTIVPRIGPFVPLAERSADAGCEVLWTREQQVALAAALLPRARRADLDRLFAVDALVAGLRPLVVGFAWAAADGLISREEAAERLEDEALVPSPAAFLKHLDATGAALAAYTAPLDDRDASDRWAALERRWTHPLTVTR